MRYLKRCYSDQLLINNACVSYGSSQLKRLWLRSVDFLIFLGAFLNFLLDFLIFSEFFNFYIYFHVRLDMSKVVTWINPTINKRVSNGFLHLIKNWLQSAVLLLFVNNSISTLKFAMLHNWATAYLIVPEIVTLAGYTVLFGHLVLIKIYCSMSVFQNTGNFVVKQIIWKT